jgi:hypothetical protein
MADVVHIIDEARRATARAVNAVMTTTYWLIGRRIVEQEQLGSAGESLMRFPLPWSHYVRLMAVRNAQAGASERLALAEAPK